MGASSCRTRQPVSVHVPRMETGSCAVVCAAYPLVWTPAKHAQTPLLARCRCTPPVPAPARSRQPAKWLACKTHVISVSVKVDIADLVTLEGRSFHCLTPQPWPRHVASAEAVPKHILATW